ncbi:MAG: serine protease, partial [Acidobacteria bacterium]
TPTPGGSELISNGGFEGSLSPWVSSGSGAFYTSNGSYAQSGTGYIYFGVNNSVSGQVYQQVSIPSTASGTLSFWLNVTSQETTTTTAYDNLYVEVRNTAGNLLSTLATYSNLDKGTAGVYSQKTLNVSAYKGQTVRIQFRATTDSSLPTTFRVDTVSLK